MSTQPTATEATPPAPNAAPAPGPAPAPAAASAARGKKPVLLLALGGLLLGGAALGAYVYAKSATAPPPPPDNSKAAEANKPKRFITKPFPVIVNLRDDGGLRHLKVSIGFETSSKEAKEEFESGSIGPQYMDLLNETLTNITIRDVDTQVGRAKLKRQIKDGLNELLANAPEKSPGFVREVFFAEFVIN